MGDSFDNLLQNIPYEPPGWDEEFYVSISKASQLSGLTESQIRYLEDLPALNIGRREGPSGRNRIYTKRDVKLLRWIYNCKDVRPAEIAQYFKEHQPQILERLEHVTLQQLIQHEQVIAGHDVLVSRLATLLLGIWRDAIVPEQVMEGVILGPKDAAWQTAFTQSVENERVLDLARCLVIWDVRQEEERRADLKILFSPRAWYLPSPEQFTYSTTWFSDPDKAFSVAIVWQRPDGQSAQQNLDHPPSVHLDKPRMILTNMLLHSLKRALDATAGFTGEPVTVYSRTTLGSRAVSSGLALLLKCCLDPYFGDCYSYVARFEKEEITVLGQSGTATAGYLPRVLNSARIVDSHRVPWWITFAREKASVALDRDTSRRPERRDEEGSVVCIPLIGQDQVVGVLGVENTCTDDAGHCLATRDDIDGLDLLRYLICIAEIAADYLNLLNSSIDRGERSRLTYTRDETLNWHWNIYQQSVWNYTDVIKEIIAWMKQTSVGAEDVLDVIIVDIVKEGMLAREYKGFDIIIDILKKTQDRMQYIIHNDAHATSLISRGHIKLFDKPIGDHLVLAALNVPQAYLEVFMERIRKLWQASNDLFVWNDQEVEVAVQVGVVTFTGLGIFDQDMMLELMRHHIWEMAHQMVAKEPLAHLLRYDATVTTEKV